MFFSYVWSILNPKTVITCSMDLMFLVILQVLLFLGSADKSNPKQKRKKSGLYHRQNHWVVREWTEQIDIKLMNSFWNNCSSR